MPAQLGQEDGDQAGALEPAAGDPGQVQEVGGRLQQRRSAGQRMVHVHDDVELAGVEEHHSHQ